MQPQRPFNTLPRHVRAALWMLVACASFTSLWILVRLVSAELPAFTILFWRSVTGVLWLLPVFLNTRGLLRTADFMPTVSRALPGMISVAAIYYAIVHAPMAKALAIQSAAPLFAAMLAILFMGLRPGIAGLMSLFVGIAGLFLVIRPDISGIEAGVVAAIISGLAQGVGWLVSRAAFPATDLRAVALWTFMGMVPLSLLLAIPDWTWPRSHVWPLLFAIGACASAGQLSVMRMTALSGIGGLPPYRLFRFLAIVAVAAFIFGEPVDPMTFVGGIAIILGPVALLSRGMG